MPMKSHLPAGYPALPELLSIKDAAKVVGISRDILRREIQNRNLAYVTIGHSKRPWYVRHEELMRWIKNSEHRNPEAHPRAQSAYRRLG